MSDADARETGYFWIRIGNQEPEVAQWQAEWGQWLVTGLGLPLPDYRAAEVVVLSEMLPPPAVPDPSVW